MTDDPNAIVPMEERWRFVAEMRRADYHALTDERTRLTRQLPAIDAIAVQAADKKVALRRWIGQRSATPEHGAELMAQYAADFALFDEQVGAPALVRERLAELPALIDEARRASEHAKRAAGTPEPPNPFGVAR